MPINEILTFGLGTGANVLAQATYNSSTVRDKGHLAGVAPSDLINKSFRQALFVSSAVAQFTAEQSGLDVLDDGDMPGLKTKLMAAIRAYAAAPAGALCGFAGTTAPTGWLKANGAAVLVASYPALAAYIYCGNTNNPTADWGYKCTDPLNPSTTRSTAGTYIVLPDYRGEGMRGFDDARGVDVSRNLFKWQGGAIESHTHTGSAVAVGDHTHAGYTDAPGDHQHYSGFGENVSRPPPYGSNGGSGNYGLASGDFDNAMWLTSAAGNHSHGVGTYGAGTHSHALSINNAGGTETRMRNIAALICIKY